MHLQTRSFHPLTLPSTSCTPQFPSSKRRPLRYSSFRCSISTLSAIPASASLAANTKPLPAETCRTILDLTPTGTLSTLSQEGWPLGIGTRFAVDNDGTPIVSLSQLHRELPLDSKSCLHVQLDQCGMRTPQCTIQGTLCKLEDDATIKRVHAAWTKRFGENSDEGNLYLLSLERVLQIENLMEDGVWISPSELKSASPDPLRTFAESIVSGINAKNEEDVLRFSNVFVDLDFQVTEAKMIWVDRLGFDMRLFSNDEAAYDVRIPFPREVTDEKGAKSSFNGMSQLAWEVEKNFQQLNFSKVKALKRVCYSGRR